MSETETRKQKPFVELLTHRLKKIKISTKGKKALFYLCLMVIPVLASTVILELRTSPYQELLNYNPSMSKVYDLSCALEVEHFNGTKQYIVLPLVDTIILDNSTARLSKQEYSFVNGAIDLNASFSYIYVLYFVPEEAFNYFQEIECYWSVDDSSGVKKKSSNGFYFNGKDYLARIDITNSMWKEDVPDLVETHVRLYSR